MHAAITAALAWFAAAAPAAAVVALPVPAAAAEPAPGSTLADAFAALVAACAADEPDARAAALERVVACEPAAVRALLARAATGTSPDAEARAGLLVLARIGACPDLALVLRLHRAACEGELESAVLAIAARDASALDALEQLARTAPAGARLAVVRAVEALGGVDAARWLARCCERDAEVRRETLARLGRLSLTLPRPLPDEVTAAVRHVLAGTDTGALRDATVAAGRMRDSDAIGHLIALLADPMPGVRADAAWALERTTGLGFATDADRWSEWHQAELRWWREESEQAFAALEQADRAEKARVLLAIGRRLAWRDRLAAAVARVLDDADAEVAALAARIAGHLGSTVAVPELQRALERPEPEVSARARAALRAIVGKEVPGAVSHAPERPPIGS